MCAARSGQLLNLTALGADCGLSATTASEWLSVLEANYLAMRLQPHHEKFETPMGFKRSKSNQVVLLRRTGSKDSTSGSPSLASANDNPRSFMGVLQAMSEKAVK
jgi:predicted AAA+ superfamily ATPase